ncbi:MAG: VOC family protein [Thermodesulfobacteriota bacterium]
MKLKLSHIGMAVDNASEFTKLFEVLGFKEITDPEPDPIQKVTARFVTVGTKQPIHIELLEPTHEGSPISNFLKKRGGGLHHLCFEVADVEEASNVLKEKGFKMVCPPVECVGYDRSFKRECGETSKIAFFLFANKILIEFLQKGR